MSITFSQYKDLKSSQEFISKYNALCEAISENNLDFFEFWHNIAIPVLENTQSRDENELLDEFLMEGIARRSFKNVFGDTLGFLGNKTAQLAGGTAGLGADVVQGTGRALWDATKKTAKGFGQGWRGVRGFDPQALGGPGNQNATNMQSYPDERPVQKTPQEIEQEKRAAIVQNQVNQKVDNVKQKFAMTMRDFVKKISDEAKMQNDPTLWKVINNFSQQISAASNNYKANVTFNKQSTGSQQFRQQRDAMMQGRQNTMKNNLMDKHTAPKQTVSGGNQPTPNASTVPTNAVTMNHESVKKEHDLLIESLIRCTNCKK